MRRLLPIFLYVAGAGAILLGTIFPLWRVLLYFPEYPDGPLQVVAYTSALTGDIPELNILNKYIGVTFPEHIPELTTLPRLLYAVVALAVIAALVGGLIGLVLKGGTIVAMAGSLGWALWRINGYLTDFGSHPDPSAPLHGLVKSFKPPLIGEIQIVQVHAISQLLYGTYFLALAILLLLVGFGLAFRNVRTNSTQRTVA